VIVLALQQLVDPLALNRCFLSHNLGRFHTFFGAPLSAMPCAPYHRLTHRSHEWRHPADETGGVLAFGPYLLDTAGRTLPRYGEEMLLGLLHLALVILFTSRPGEAIPKDVLIDTACLARRGGDHDSLEQAISDGRSRGQLIRPHFTLQDDRRGARRNRKAFSVDLLA
jgi:hypothetical protein